MVEIAHIVLILPDGRAVLQRRDNNTPISPNTLAFFGGHVEPGEPPDEAMRRELGEETSLDVANLDIRLVNEFELTRSNDGVLTHFYTYEAEIPNAKFEVYEGSGAEVYPTEELLAREDVVPAVKHAIRKLGD